MTLDKPKAEAKELLIRWSPAERMPLDVFSLVREAARCYEAACYLATIAMSGAAVEVVMNRDRRTRSLPLRRIDGWATLNNGNLDKVRDAGLPVDTLLSAGESTKDAATITFVRLRNKVAHGDFGEFVRTLSDYDANAKAAALDQATRAIRFVAEWFNAAPDVQDGHINNHQWPSAD